MEFQEGDGAKQMGEEEERRDLEYTIGNYSRWNSRLLVKKRNNETNAENITINAREEKQVPDLCSFEFYA